LQSGTSGRPTASATGISGKSILATAATLTETLADMEKYWARRAAASAGRATPKLL
jgi:hypothetical protein